MLMKQARAMLAPVSQIQVMALYSIINENNLWEKQISIKRNEFLVEENTINQSLFFVIDGSLKISCIIDNEEQIIRLGYPNSFLTALDSFLNNSPTKYSITAIKSATLKSISKNNLLHFLEKNQLQNIWINVLNTLILQQNEREIDLLTTSAKDRYEGVLKRSPKLFQNIPQKYIANYLRVSPETLSRLMKKS